MNVTLGVPRIKETRHFGVMRKCTDVEHMCVCVCVCAVFMLGRRC